jgi:polyphosphate kinase 2 (PPK2 family)
MIGIFNRSYYEECLVVRVHPEILKSQRMPPQAKGRDVWGRRFREINDWERYLVDNGTKIVKLFLNVSKEEQRERFLARIGEPEKNWKFSAADARERRYWDDYQRAFEAVLSNTSTAWAPWYVIPADRKWFMRLAAASVIIDAMMQLDPHYPRATPEAMASMEEARVELLAEGPLREGVVIPGVTDVATVAPAATGPNGRGRKQKG